VSKLKRGYLYIYHLHTTERVLTETRGYSNNTQKENIMAGINVPKMNAQQTYDMLSEALANNRPIGGTPWEHEQIRGLDGKYSPRQALTRFESGIMQQQMKDLAAHIEDWGPEGEMKYFAEDFGLNQKSLNSFRLPYEYHFSGAQGLSPKNFKSSAVDPEHIRQAQHVLGGYALSGDQAHLVNTMGGVSGTTGDNVYMVLGDRSTPLSMQEFEYNPDGSLVMEEQDSPQGRRYQAALRVGGGQSGQQVYPGEHPFSRMIPVGSKAEYFDNKGGIGYYEKPTTSYANNLTKNYTGKLHSDIDKANRSKAAWLTDAIRKLPR